MKPFLKYFVMPAIVLVFGTLAQYAYGQDGEKDTMSNNVLLKDWTGPYGGVPPWSCLLYTSPSPRDRTRSRMPSSA